MKYQSLILICFIYITTGGNKRQEASIYSPVNLGIIPAPKNVHTSGASSQLKEKTLLIRFTCIRVNICRFNKESKKLKESLIYWHSIKQ